VDTAALIAGKAAPAEASAVVEKALRKLSRGSPPETWQAHVRNAL
jgi:hypothetical protein